ncbi:MAG TPA: hypothetical protein VL946_01885 [Lacibacter sp.]|jgi:hypothetical protein|nr:hypothetical protein [Lacibacter sp.]
MKKLFSLAILLSLSVVGFSQAGKEKAKDKGKAKNENTSKGKNSNSSQENANNSNQSNNSDQQNGNSKTRKNIPAKVGSAFAGEYPNAVNAVWTKKQGDWTVIFGNGTWRSTATYHSNGERVDTRTPMTREQAPRPVLDEILRRFPKGSPTDVIKIEKPKNPNLFQIIVDAAGKKKTFVFDETGKLVSGQ